MEGSGVVTVGIAKFSETVVVSLCFVAKFILGGLGTGDVTPISMLGGHARGLVPEIKLPGPKLIKMGPCVVIGVKLAPLSILRGKEACIKDDLFANGDKIVVVLVVSDKICKEISAVDLFDDVGLVWVPQCFHVLLVCCDVMWGWLAPFNEHSVEQITECPVRDSSEHLGEDTAIVGVSFDFAILMSALLVFLCWLWSSLFFCHVTWTWALYTGLPCS